MQRFGLYYPYVHFADDSWIKASALYWPRMARIIPPNFAAYDSSVVRELRDSLNFVLDVDPSPVVEYVSRIVEEAVGAYEKEVRSRLAIERLNFPLARFRRLYVPVNQQGMYESILSRDLFLRQREVSRSEVR